MDKIVPSLLFNIDPKDFDFKSEGRSHDRDTPDLGSAIDDEHSSPSRAADQILRELVMSASYSSIKTILPTILHFMKLR